MKIKQLAIKAGMSIKKNSPAILVGAGVIGLGATAVLAYKSRKKVEIVVENIEAARERGEEINKMAVARDIAEAIYLPVTVGVASVGAILWSYKIQNNRIAVLASSLAVQRAQNIWFEKKYKEEHGEEAYNKFVTPTAQETYTEVDSKGKEKQSVKDVKADVDKTIGQWYSDSSEYYADDHSYNLAFIDSVNEKLQLIHFQRGYLQLNEVYDALGFERTRNGALLGWSAEDSFEIIKHVSNIGDPDMGETKEQIYVTWTRPQYIYGKVEFTGRYAGMQ